MPLPTVGLSAARKLLGALIRPDCGVHAVLLYGPQGAGKRDLAHELARHWLCPQPADGEPCGVCSSCRTHARSVCPDVLEIHPKGPSALIKQAAIQETKGSKLEQGDSPSLRQWIRTMPLAAKHKVVWIHHADRMNTSAANALLKSLEEPQPYAKLILATTAIGRMMPTIVSRCVTVACELPTEEEIRRAMPDAPDWALALAENSPGYTQDLLYCADLYQGLVTLARDAVQGPPGAAYRHAETFRKLADGLEDRRSWTARAAQVESIRVLATALAQLGAPPRAVQLAIEAHRRVSNNGHVGLVMEAFFARISGLMRGA